MQRIEAERFPEAVTVLEERFGDGAEDVNDVCTKCGHDKADPLWHSEIPADLGEGVVCLGVPSGCPECGTLLGRCPSWCSFARFGR